MTAAPSTTVTLHMSEAEFLAHYADLKPSYEFVDGEVTQKPMTKRDPMLLQDELQEALRAYRRSEGGLSGADPTVNLSGGPDRQYRAPAVAYWAPGKPQGGQVLSPPTLAVEIQSPGQTLRFLRGKCREYLQRGVDVVWLVLSAQRAIEVFEEGRDRERLTPPAMLRTSHLPGFELRLDELFGVLDE